MLLSGRLLLTPRRPTVTTRLGLDVLLSSVEATREGWTITDGDTAGASFRDGLAARLGRWSGRPTLVAVAAMNAIIGVAVAVMLAPVAGGVDARTYRLSALYVVEGGFDSGLLYPPTAALAFRPLAWISPTAAAIVMTLFGVAVLVAGVRFETRGMARVDRLLVGVAAFGFAPVVFELILGQVTLLIAAALYPVTRGADRVRNGIPVGIALALAPKPVVLMVLVWMLIWRPRALAAALLAAVVVTCLGVVLLGPDQYRQWFSGLTGAVGESAAGTSFLVQSGTYSLWPLDPARIVVAAAVAGATLWTILKDPSRGFVAALFASLLLAPYTGFYSVSILLLAVTPALAFSPRATRVLALTANPVLALLPWVAAWSAGGLIACFPFERRPRLPRRLGHP